MSEILQSAKDVPGEAVAYSDDPYECVREAAAILLLTKWPEYGELDWANIDKSAREGGLFWIAGGY